MTPSGAAHQEASTSSQPLGPSPASPRPQKPLGRTEQLMRVQLQRPQHDGTPERTGSLTTGIWSLDPDGRPSGLSAAVVMDNTLATSIHAAAADLDWIVTTELQLNFILPLPADGTVLEAWTSAVLVDSMGGMSQGTLQGPDGTIHVQSVGWFQGVGANSSDALDHYSRMAALPLGPETEVPLATMLRMQGTPGTTDDDRPRVSEGFRPGPLFADNEELMNPHGAVHGGALTMMSGLAAQQAMPDRTDYDLQSLRALFLRPARGAVTARTRVRHAGRSLRIVDVELVGGVTDVGNPAASKPFVQAEAVFRAAR
ncbi:PaaI family thioesterase [Citricoccus parietis]|uniref:PaaI family thioesterase n=1 Tax=Citricoccus parietis TaxID=592307 RepID=UPI003672FE96